MHDTRSVAESFLAKAGARDIAVVDLFAENVDWFVPGEGLFPWSGKRHHRSELPAFFETLWPYTVPGETQVLSARLVVDGDDAIFLGRFSNLVARTGKRFTLDIVFDLTVTDGQITRMHVIEDTLAAARAFELV